MSDATDLISLGRIAGAFGLRGDVRVKTSDPTEFSAGQRLTARAADGSEREVVIDSVRVHKRDALLRLPGIGDATAADAFRGTVLLGRRVDLAPLPVGTYRDSELIGLRVVDNRLGDLGLVDSVLHYPAADMLVIGDRLVPLLKAYGARVDLASRVISTELPPGFEQSWPSSKA